MGMTVPALRYLGQSWWKLPGSWKQNKQMLSCLATPVRDYAERNPHGGYDAIVNRFGKPDQVAESYLADMEVEELSKHLRIRKRIVLIVGASALAIVLLWTGVVCIALAEAKSNAGGIISEEIQIIERTDYEEGE